jgi:hypothetical protein
MIVGCGAFSAVIFYAFSIKCFSPTYSTGSTKESAGAAQRAAIGSSAMLGKNL